MRKAVIAAIAIASIASAVKADEAVNSARCPTPTSCTDDNGQLNYWKAREIVKNRHNADVAIPSVQGSAVASQAQAPRETRHTFNYPPEFSMIENAPVSSMKFFGLLGKAHEMQPGDKYEAKLCNADAAALQAKADAIAPGALAVRASAYKTADESRFDPGTGDSLGQWVTIIGETLCSMDLTAGAGYKIVYRTGSCGAANAIASASTGGSCQLLTLVK